MANTHPVPSLIIRKAFPGIPKQEAEEMARLGMVNTYPLGAVLCHENVLEDIFYILLEGQVEVTKMVNAGEARLMKILQPGDFFGEMSLIHNAPRAATVTATKPVSVLEISKENFNVLLQHSSVLALSMVREVSRRLRENDEMAIGDLRIKARELADAYQQLAEMDYARHEFLTTIAHELRTPLMAASGYLQAMRSGMMQGEMLGAGLETVSRNIQEIISLVNDLLFLQEMDLILFDFQPTNLDGLITGVIEAKRSMAERNGVTLNLSIAPNLPLIQADAKSLERALLAIVDNAIKFSPEGGEVRVEVTSRNGEAAIAVDDQGVGIPPESLPRIFERFFHLDEANGHLFRGTGLGLSIARAAIEQHGGRIEVQSDQGKGSTFVVHLPLDERKSGPAAAV